MLLGPKVDLFEFENHLINCGMSGRMHCPNEAQVWNLRENRS